MWTQYTDLQGFYLFEIIIFKICTSISLFPINQGVFEEVAIQSAKFSHRQQTQLSFLVWWQAPNPLGES